MIFFAFLIGTHKMLQVIIATTCITLIVLWRSGSIAFVSYSIAQQGTLEIFGFWSTAIVSFIQSAEITTSLWIYVWLLVYAIHYATPSVVMSSGIVQSKLVQFLLSPLAIFTMIISLTVAIFGIDIFSLSFLASMQAKFWWENFIYKYIQYLPLWVLVQGLIALFLLFQKEKKIELSYDDI